MRKSRTKCSTLKLEDVKIRGSLVHDVKICGGLHEILFGEIASKYKCSAWSSFWKLPAQNWHLCSASAVGVAKLFSPDRCAMRFGEASAFTWLHAIPLRKSKHVCKCGVPLVSGMVGVVRDSCRSMGYVGVSIIVMFCRISAPTLPGSRCIAIA